MCCICVRARFPVRAATEKGFISFLFDDRKFGYPLECSSRQGNQPKQMGDNALAYVYLH